MRHGATAPHVPPSTPAFYRAALRTTDEDDFLPTWAKGDPTGTGPALVPVVHELTTANNGNGGGNSSSEETPGENAVMGAARPSADAAADEGGSAGAACVRCVAARDMAAGEAVVPRDPWDY